MRANCLPLPGLILSNSRSSSGAVHAPSIKSPKRRSWASSQALAGPALSGAGPYSRLSRISATLISALLLMHRVAEGRRVLAGHVVFKLALNIAQQRAGAKAEEVGLHPLIAQLLFDQN